MPSARPKPARGTTFAERLEYARDRQRILGFWKPDGALASAIGVAPSQVSEYKARETAPSSERTLALAKEMEVDPGWLAFGEESAAPAPDGFAAWFQRRAARAHGQRMGPSVIQEPDPKIFDEPALPRPKPAAKKRRGA